MPVQTTTRQTICSIVNCLFCCCPFGLAAVMCLGKLLTTKTKPLDTPPSRLELENDDVIRCFRAEYPKFSLARSALASNTLEFSLKRQKIATLFICTYGSL